MKTLGLPPPTRPEAFFTNGLIKLEYKSRRNCSVVPATGQAVGAAPQIWIERLSTASAASRTASDGVGCKPEGRTILSLAKQAQSGECYRLNSRHPNDAGQYRGENHGQIDSQSPAQKNSAPGCRIAIPGKIVYPQSFAAWRIRLGPGLP